MKYNGKIEIKKGFSLESPTAEVKGIFKYADDISLITGYYIEVWFSTESDNVQAHSRSWDIEEGVTVEEFIASNDVLKQFV